MTANEFYERYNIGARVLVFNSLTNECQLGFVCDHLWRNFSDYVSIHRPGPDSPGYESGWHPDNIEVISAHREPGAVEGGAR